jgi:hypothetical protein
LELIFIIQAKNKIAGHIRESLSTEKEKDKEFNRQSKELNIKESLKTIINTEKAFNIKSKERKKSSKEKKLIYKNGDIKVCLYKETEKMKKLFSHPNIINMKDHLRTMLSTAMAL